MLKTRTIVAINALLLALLALASQLYILYNQERMVLALVVVFVFVFLISFLSINISVKRLVINRIKPLYKLIRKRNVNDVELKKEIKNTDPILAFTKNLDDWANAKKSEVMELTEMEKYRKEFLGNVSHELKTPLFNIQGYIFTLLDGGLEDKSINKKYLERTAKSIDRLIAIVNDLESISGLETGDFDLNMEKFDIVSLVEDVFELQELRAEKRNIKLEMKQKGRNELWVLADKKRIFQVLTNLVANSIYYGKDGGKTIISFSEYDNNYIIDVKDNGIGIAEEHLPRIFERFYRVDKSRSRKQGGTGLGLAIVKHLIEAHKQTINIRSELGKGTSIAFTLKKV